MSVCFKVSTEEVVKKQQTESPTTIKAMTKSQRGELETLHTRNRPINRLARMSSFEIAPPPQKKNNGRFLFVFITRNIRPSCQILARNWKICLYVVKKTKSIVIQLNVLPVSLLFIIIKLSGPKITLFDSFYIFLISRPTNRFSEFYSAQISIGLQRCSSVRASFLIPPKCWPHVYLYSFVPLSSTDNVCSSDRGTDKPPDGRASS